MEDMIATFGGLFMLATGMSLAYLVLYLLGAFVLAIPVMLLWNATVPEITSWGDIGYWQTYALLILLYLLFRFPGVGFGASN